MQHNNSIVTLSCIISQISVTQTPLVHLYSLDHSERSVLQLLKMKRQIRLSEPNTRRGLKTDRYSIVQMEGINLALMENKQAEGEVRTSE